MKSKLFELLQQINQKPLPYKHYTTPELWCDPYISKQMLALHISEETELASRKKDFIDRSAKWISDYFKIGDQTQICDFGCGPGLYTTKFAQNGAIVTGIDFSTTSINYAKEQDKLNNSKINYILQDYLEFEIDKKFDLITMIYCDFCVLNPIQRKTLLKIFYNHLQDNGSILFDVSSFAQYAAKQETMSYEYSKKDGFWSPAAYYAFHNCFKYKDEYLLLDKFTIIENSRIRENYNWLQCYNIQTITEELRQNNFKVVDYFANVAGDTHKENSSEIAIVAKKAPPEPLQH